MASPGELTLSDPQEMTAEQKREALRGAVARDDLLGVLLYLRTAEDIDVAHPNDGSTVLELALAAPTSRIQVRKLVLECLLHRGASPSIASGGRSELEDVVYSWLRGGEEAAVAARELLALEDLHDAERWISEAGLALEDSDGNDPAETTTERVSVKLEPDEHAPLPLLAEPPQRVLDSPVSASGILRSSPRASVDLSTEVSPRRCSLRSSSAQTPSSDGSYLVKIINLPPRLPKHALHDLVLRFVFAQDILHVGTPFEFDDAWTAQVELGSHNASVHLVKSLRNLFYRYARLDAVVCPLESTEDGDDEPSGPPATLLRRRPLPLAPSARNHRWDDDSEEEPDPAPIPPATRSLSDLTKPAALGGYVSETSRSAVEDEGYSADDKASSTNPSPKRHLVRILHLPFWLPAHELRNFLSMKISPSEVIKFRVSHDVAKHESIGHVELHSEKAKHILIDRVSGDRYRKFRLEAVEGSQTDEDTLEMRPVPIVVKAPPRGPRASRTSFDPDSHVWIRVTSMPRSWSQRRLHEELERFGVIAQHILIRRTVGDSRRSASIALSTRRDADKVKLFLANLQFADSDRLGVYDPGLDSGTATPYPTSAHQKYPYQHPSIAVDRPGRDPLVVRIAYISPRVTQRRLVEEIESRVGARVVADSDLISIVLGGVCDAERLATITTRSIEDAKLIIHEMDGAVLDGDAVYAHWTLDALEPFEPNVSRAGRTAAGEQSRSRSPPRPPSRNLPSRRTGPRSRSRSPPRRDSVNEAPPSPPLRPHDPHCLASESAADARLALDISRVRSLNLSHEDLAAIERIWTPLERAPSPSPSSSEQQEQQQHVHQTRPPRETEFHREVDVTVKFGFLAQSDAVAALGRTDPVFRDDSALEHRYRAFLASQAGVARDYYTVFFAQLFDWNVYSQVFANRGRQEAAEARKRDASRTA
ncbi:hypothetical protein JCM11491_004709 [Sporobolomyces phaffii]